MAWGISEPNVLKRTDRSSDIHRVATISRETDLDRLHFLIETQRLINAGAPEAERVMAVVLERVQHVTDADGAAVEIVDGDALVYRAVSGIAENSDGIRVDLESTLSGLCVRMGMPLLCRDTESDSRVDREACRMVAARSMAVAPLVHSGETVGVFSVFSSETDHFSNADSDVIELMAGFLAPHLSNSSKLEDEAHRALQDPVTGLPNRMILMDRLQQAVYDARRYARPFGLFVVELEGLEALSSALGRDATDAVGRAVGRGLDATVRSGDTLARIDGEQFVILCINADRTVVEERIRTRVDSVLDSVTNEIGMDGCRLTANVGIVWSSGSDASPESLLTTATTAAYRARRQRGPSGPAV